jgi:hypothetical protein
MTFTRDLEHSSESMTGHSVENVSGSATVYFETAAVLMKERNYNIFCCFYGCFTWSITLTDEYNLTVHSA